MKILVVEDQKKMSSFLKRGLTEASYAVDVAETGQAAESLSADNEYDLIILDVMLPDQNGLDTARHLRRDGYNGPLLMLSALGASRDKVYGLNSGADDYLAKPFAFEELLARVRALLRRNRSEMNSVLSVGDIEMNLVSRRVTRAGNEVRLTPKEFALLEYFMRNPDRPVSRTEISEHIWEAQFDTESNVIDVYINMLRKKIDQPYGKKLIQTVVGSGYVLKA